MSLGLDSDLNSKVALPASFATLPPELAFLFPLFRVPSDGEGGSW